MDWTLDNLTPQEEKRLEQGLGPHGLFFLIIVPRLIEEPPYFPRPDIPDNPHSPRFREWMKKGPFSPFR